MKNPYKNHANWLVQNDRHGKTSLDSFIKSFNIPESKNELFSKRLEFLCYIIFKEGQEAKEIEFRNDLRNFIGLEELDSENTRQIDFD